MPVILKYQDVMAGLPEMRGDAEYIGHAAAIARTNQDCGGRFLVGNIPASYLMISTERGERNDFGRQTEFIWTERIAIKWSASFRTGERFYKIDRYTKQNSYQTNTATNSTDHYSLQRSTQILYFLQLKHRSFLPF